MSVSFYPSIENNVPHVIRCICGEWEYNDGEVFRTREKAQTARRETGAHISQCSDPYCDYAYVQPKVREPEVQMSNHNSVSLLQVLGLMSDGDKFEDVCFGSIPAEDFLGRILIALELHEAKYQPATIMGIVYTPERSEEYVSQRLNQMLDVANWAIDNKRSITWS